MRSICSLIFLVILVLWLPTEAQKLPNIQKISVWAPSNIKIDGKATEWNEKYQAYNNATDIDYTLSNDDKNLYLLIKSTNTFLIAEKILARGISFTINHTISKKDDAAITVTYPLLQGEDSRLLSSLFYAASGIKTGGNSAGDNSPARFNKTLNEKSKYIGAKGIKNITDNQISIYNSLDIKVASASPAPGIYIYELAIPLTLLALPESGTKGFSYQIKMNAREEVMQQHGNRPVVNPNAPPEPSPAPPLYTSTDFWGEYTLAKTP